jgi:hypothetical protein
MVSGLRELLETRRKQTMNDGRQRGEGVTFLHAN